MKNFQKKRIIGVSNTYYMCCSLILDYRGTVVSIGAVVRKRTCKISKNFHESIKCVIESFVLLIMADIEKGFIHGRVKTYAAETFWKTRGLVKCAVFIDGTVI